MSGERPLTAEEEAELRRRLANGNRPVDLWPLTGARLLATLDAVRTAPEPGEGLRARLHDLQDWLIHPDRSYSPHEIAMEAHDRIAAALAAVAPEPTAEHEIVHEGATGLLRCTTHDVTLVTGDDFAAHGHTVGAAAAPEPTAERTSGWDSGVMGAIYMRPGGGRIVDPPTAAPEPTAERLDVERLARAFHVADHPAVPDCRLGPGSTEPGRRYCEWKAERIAAEYERLARPADGSER